MAAATWTPKKCTRPSQVGAAFWMPALVILLAYEAVPPTAVLHSPMALPLSLVAAQRTS